MIGACTIERHANCEHDAFVLAFWQKLGDRINGYHVVIVMVLADRDAALDPTHHRATYCRELV